MYIWPILKVLEGIGKNHSKYFHDYFATWFIHEYLDACIITLRMDPGLGLIQRDDTNIVNAYVRPYLKYFPYVLGYIASKWLYFLQKTIKRMISNEGWLCVIYIY